MYFWPRVDRVETFISRGLYMMPKQIRAKRCDARHLLRPACWWDRTTQDRLASLVSTDVRCITQHSFFVEEK